MQRTGYKHPEKDCLSGNIIDDVYYDKNSASNNRCSRDEHVHLFGRHVFPRGAGKGGG